MIAALLILCIIARTVYSVVCNHFRRHKSTQTSLATTSELLDIAKRHDLAATLSDLVETDGAGSWPPKADHSSWPSALVPYRRLYDELFALIPRVGEQGLSDDDNLQLMNQFREMVRVKLSESVDLLEVERVLATVAEGDWDGFSRDAYNGFWCCMANFRHAYRYVQIHNLFTMLADLVSWALLPIVKVAQQETIVDFPPELVLPWEYLQRHFGVTSDSGNNTSNVLCNFDQGGQRTFTFAKAISEEVTSSEENFFRIFYDLEVQAFPIYKQMVSAVISYSENDKAACTRHLRDVSSSFRELLQVYYQNMRDSRVGQKVWLRWVQGLQGWGAGRMIDGEFVKFSGLSASQVLFFQCIDAFLGLSPFLSEQDAQRSTPLKQRNLAAAFRKFSFRDQLKLRDDAADASIIGEFTKIVNQMKSFRAAHRTRCMPFLREPLPERIPMTAGMFQPSGLEKGLSNTKTGIENTAWEPLLRILTTRLRQTK